MSSSDSDDVSGSSSSVIAKRDSVGKSIESPSSASSVRGCGRGAWAEGAIRLYGGINQVCWYSDMCIAHLYSMASCKEHTIKTGGIPRRCGPRQRPTRGMGVACDKQRVSGCNYVVCLNVLESLLFTLWPYVASEAVCSTTNLMAPCALLGIGCLLCSHARMLMYGHDGVALLWWQHTATARKIAVVLYYSSASLLLVLASCSAISSYVRTKIGPKQSVVAATHTVARNPQQ